MNFGEHLTIDGYGGNFEKLNNKNLVLQCLDELPILLGMKKLADPQIFFAKGNDKKDPGGWSGYVIIEESHISIHTFPARGFISADAYSCKNGLDKDFVISYLKQKFDLKGVETNFIKRGTKYPSNNIYKL